MTDLSTRSPVCTTNRTCAAAYCTQTLTRFVLVAAFCRLLLLQLSGSCSPPPPPPLPPQKTSPLNKSLQSEAGETAWWKSGYCTCPPISSYSAQLCRMVGLNDRTRRANSPKRATELSELSADDLQIPGSMCVCVWVGVRVCVEEIQTQTQHCTMGKPGTVIVLIRNGMWWWGLVHAKFVLSAGHILLAVVV